MEDTTAKLTFLYGERLFRATEKLLDTNKFYIAGGVLRTFVEDIKLVGFQETDTPVYSKDIDCFFGDSKAFFQAKESLINKGYKEGKKRTNSVEMEKAGQTTYDLVFLEYISNARSVIDDFDFTNCCIAFGDTELVTSETFFQDVKDRKLVINNVKIPYHTIARAGKFIKKGYTITDEDKVKLFDNAATSPFSPYEEDEYEEQSLTAPTEQSSGDDIAVL